MLKRFWLAIADNIIGPSRLNFTNFRALMYPGERSPQVRRHMAAVIIARVQLVSALFAVLVPVFSVVDIWVFDRMAAGYMVILRLIAAGVFALLAWPRELSASSPYRQAMQMLLALLMIPPLFHLFSVGVLGKLAETEGQQLLMHLYGYLPTIVLGGLAIFPLTALESLLLAIPVIVVGVLSLVVMDAPMTLAAQGGTLWFMMMMLSLAMFSGMSQCHYMMNLVYQATHDALTGVYTRQSGEDALSLLQRLASMSGKPLSVAFVDVDRFKSVNDTFGHEAGDEILRQLVQRLSAGLRRTDFVVRWGGEEFLVVLPDTPPEHIHGLFVRLREQGLGFRPDGEPLTASIGVASSSEIGIDDWHTLVTVADHRMYAAKQSGRDCIVLGDGVPRPFTARLAEQVA